MLMAKSLREIAEHLRVHLVGDPEIEVTSVASIRFASASDLVFVESEKNLEEGLASKAAALIVGKFALHGGLSQVSADIRSAQIVVRTRVAVSKRRESART
jgi:UDP-3-O-[3-hydroxymyristoyl] glucosamine N-acyltransferase